MKVKVEDNNIRELRDFTVLMIESVMNGLHTSIKEPSVRVMNIMAGRDVDMNNLDDETKRFAMNQAMANQLAAIKTKMLKVMEETRVYEQVIITCDRLLKNEYDFKGNLKNVTPE